MQEQAFRGSIAIRVEVVDDDSVDVIVVSRHPTEADVRAWLERELPCAELPHWAARRRHATADAVLYGRIEAGWYVETADEVSFEPDLDTPGCHADLVDGALRRHPSP